MSRCLRYQNKAVQEHLASQYTAGLMTARVRARTEQLKQEIPELNSAISQWSDTFSSIANQLPEVAPSSSVWERIDHSINSGVPITTNVMKEKVGWWNNLSLWRFTTLASLATCLSLAWVIAAFYSIGFGQKDFMTVSVKGGPSYMAAMSRANDTAGGVLHSELPQANEIVFVVNAYGKTESAPSRLFVQWSKQSPRQDTSPFHLWAEHRETGELSYIGIEPEKGKLWNLTKTTWDAISTSGRLLVTVDNQMPVPSNTLFAGPCIQLGNWASAET